MAVVFVYVLPNCRARSVTTSKVDRSCDDSIFLSEEEATDTDYIPSETIEAMLTSSGRVLVMGGIVEGDSSHPLSVVRHLDFDFSGNNQPTWSTPVSLHIANTSTGRKKLSPTGETAFPVRRIGHTMTFVADTDMAFLIGGVKLTGRHTGELCRTVFCFDTHCLNWKAIDGNRPSMHRPPDSILGERFGHTAHYISTIRPTTSSAHSSSEGHILVYGGYTTMMAPNPVAHVHLFDIKSRTWSLLAPAEGGDAAPARAFHVSAVTSCKQYLVVQGGISRAPPDPDVSSDIYTFHLDTRIWRKVSLHPSSDRPPALRSRHSICHGVGLHTGSFLVFGGALGQCDECSGIYIFRVFHIDEGNAHAGPSVIWERMTVRASNAPVLLGCDNAPTDGQAMSTEYMSKWAAESVTLIALPKLEQYVVIGGQGSEGIGDKIFMLQPGGTSDIAVADSSPHRTALDNS